jgi:hypothetical protein
MAAFVSSEGRHPTQSGPSDNGIEWPVHKP